MKQRKYPILIIISTLFLCVFVNCSSFNDILDTEKVEPLQTEIKIQIELEGFDSPEGLSIVLMNYLENIRIEKEFSGLSVVLDSLIPGIYTVTISGKAYDNQGQLYYLNGGLVNHPLIKNNETIEIAVSGLKISPLVFKEIYYAGSAPNYFRDQFYEYTTIPIQFFIWTASILPLYILLVQQKNCLYGPRVTKINTSIPIGYGNSPIRETNIR